MAESTGDPQLEVKIGGDITQLQASIIAAENELRGFQAEIKKTTDTGRIAELSKSIEVTQQKIAGMRQEMGRSAGASNQAINALGNVSRVAQDASYGFMGIANNLNPLFESFQRLQASSGGTGNALKQMGAALTGPAGIGLAIGVVSSLIVSFGDELADFANTKLSGVTDAMKLEAMVFKEAQEGYVKATQDINGLNQAHDDYTNGIISKEQFLKKFNSTLGDTIKKTDDLATAEKFLRDGADQYIQMMYYKAISTEALNQAAKKQVESLQKQTAPLEPTLLQRTVSFFAPAGSDDAEERAAKARKEEIDGLDNDAYILKDIAENYKTLGDNMQFNLRRIFGAPSDNQSTSEESDIKILAKQELEATERWVAKLKQKLKESQEVLKNERIKLFTLPSERRAEESKRSPYFDKLLKENLESSNKSGLGDLLEKDSKKRIAAYKEEDKQLKELQKSQEDFANSVADFGANAFRTLFNTLENGGSVLESLSNLFKQLAIDIAAAAIRAAIFEAIMAAIDVSTGGGASAAKGGGNILKSIFGFAEGGIVTKPTLGLIGEAGQNEAIIPLSKLNSFMKTSFSAGAMSGNGGGNGGGGVAVLRGQDLLISINRTQRASALKGQNISLL
jgi:hypothetical protein